jgi:hypothetical protein
MNDELERICKETIVNNLRYYPSIFLQGVREITKTPVRVAGLQDDI